MINQLFPTCKRFHSFGFFKAKEREECIVEHLAKDENETLVMKLNKQMATFTNIPFGDTSKLPLTLIDEELGVKALVDFDEEIHEFVLDINGEPFECHVYLDPSFNPDSKEVKSI